MKAAEHVMNPYDTATLKMGVTSIRAATNNANNTTVEWSYPYHAYPVTACASVKAMPASGMITAGNAAIVVESEYMYKPFLNNLIPGFKTQFLWQDTITHAPRNASVVYGCEQSCGGGCP